MTQYMSNKHYKKPGQWHAYLAIAWYSLRAQTRNPATFFFGFIFPLVFISIFGLIGGSTPKINVGVPDGNGNTPIVRMLSKQPYFTVSKDSRDNLEKKIRQG